MSKEKIVLCEDLADIMPPEYQELVEGATFADSGVIHNVEGADIHRQSERAGSLVTLFLRRDGHPRLREIGV